MEHKHHKYIISEQTEKNILIVIILTIITMLLEICYGYITNSMALLADGWHMSTHAFAFCITYFAYRYIKKLKIKENKECISEKISSLAGYTSSILLLVMGGVIIVESIGRIIVPLNISFTDAIIVALVGLTVNVVCIMVMEYKNCEAKKSDYNYKSAYLHILTDIMTSIFAIIALLSGKILHFYILDPIMGIVGGILILKWSISLIKDSANNLIFE